MTAVVYCRVIQGKKGKEPKLSGTTAAVEVTRIELVTTECKSIVLPTKLHPHR